jgi:hypothetical protein
MSGCDRVRCQTEGCDASELCGCCLNAEVERLTTAIQRVRDLCQESGPGWIEWLMPGVATTHIAHVSEDGYIYLPGGEGTDDFLLASARGRSWRLLSVVDIARALDGDSDE